MRNLREEFELVEQLYNGSDHDMWRSIQKNTNTTIIIYRFFYDDLFQYLRETAVTSKIYKSEYLARFIESIPHVDRGWIVMEYPSLGSLDSLVKIGLRCDEVQLREIASFCLLGLEFLHSRCTGHYVMNIVPTNVFLTEKGLVKLGFCGCRDMRFTLYHWNMKWFDAPEFREGKGTIRSDVYSLGCLLMWLNDPSCNDENKKKSVKGTTSPLFDSFVEECRTEDPCRRPYVSKLMNHPFVREAVERIRRVGYSEVLLEFANRQKCREINKEVQKKELTDPQLSLYHYDVGWYHEGVAKTESVLMEMSRERVIEVDTETKQLLKVNGEEVKGVEHKRVLDLSDDGERWEGDVLNDQPYGWGVLYDREGEKVYEGFRLTDVNVCYGRSYYPDIQKVEYEGGICEGKRWGRGVLYDRRGNTVFEGVWINDTKEIEKSGMIDLHNQLLHTQLEELVVSNECCSEEERTVFDFRLLANLQRLKVGDKCFKYVTEVELVGMKQLKKVEIGEDSFTPDSCWPPRKGCFRMKDCPLLREMTIGDHSFSYYSVCEIENVPSLRVLEIGKRGGRSVFEDAPLELRSQ